MKFKFCPYCSNKLHLKMHEDVNRLYCNHCKIFHYQNPTVGVAVIIVKENRLLLVKRTGSYKEKWCIPCGHVEWGEDIKAAAKREIMEETGLIVSPGPVFAVHSNFHNPDKQTVGIWFWGECVRGKLHAGSDASEADFFLLDDLPKHMAFPTDIYVCKQLRHCLESGGITTWLNSCVAQKFSSV